MIATPMQPIYMTGHTRPVRKVMYNYDGDLLFSCSDDGKVNMYNTFKCDRIGQFDVKAACNSIDVTKDSKYLLATQTTFGVYVFKIEDGSLLGKIKMPSIQVR